jgi:hypothetical protein
MTIYAGDATGSSQVIYVPPPSWLQAHGSLLVFCVWLVILTGLLLLVWKYRARLFDADRYQLNSPVSRLGFVVLVGASVVFAASWLGALADDDGHRFYRTVMTFDGYAYRWWQQAGRWAIVLAGIGAVLAWAYRPTLGRLLDWIRHG